MVVWLPVKDIVVKTSRLVRVGDSGINVPVLALRADIRVPEQLAALGGEPNGGSAENVPPMQTYMSWVPLPDVNIPFSIAMYDFPGLQAGG
jgi:hypothetical protein